MTDYDRSIPTNPDTLTWLHLSDFHFKEKEDWRLRPVLNSLIRDVIHELPRQNLAPDLILLTGDIAFSGKATEYKRAVSFFQEIATSLSLDPKERWFLVPGNHDVDRDLVQPPEKYIRDTINENTADDIMKAPKTWKEAAKRQRAFFNFTKSFLGNERKWQAKQPWMVEQYKTGDLVVALLQLNSAWLSQENEETKKLVMGEYQIRQALTCAEKFNPHLKIAMFHHPLDDLKEFDRIEAEKLLKGGNGCHFLLRGHMHQLDLQIHENPSSTCLPLASGACWENKKYPHAVMVVQLDLTAGKINIYAWTYSPGDGGFWKPINQIYQRMNEKWCLQIPPKWGLGNPTTLKHLSSPEKAKISHSENNSFNATEKGREGNTLEIAFIESLTEQTGYDSHILARFRNQLRPEKRRLFPDNLSDGEFLKEFGYMKNERLTNAGVLLFTRKPELIITSASIQCTKYNGLDKHSSWSKEEILGPIQFQIESAYNFVATSIEKVEFSDPDSVKTKTIYSYPMICVREMIANAICHRDYRNQQITYVRIFSNRIEIASPGIWGNGRFGRMLKPVKLSKLESEPMPPNLHLAKGVAAINMVEIEGRGIPVSILDCERINAPEPDVREIDCYVKVTIFPRDINSIRDAKFQILSVNKVLGPLVPKAYHGYLEDLCRDIESMVGTDRPLHFRLDQIYAPLSTDWESPEEREARERDRRKKAEQGKGSRHEGPDSEGMVYGKARRRKLEELLAFPGHRHFLVVGGAGSGKSTFLRYSARRILDQGEFLPILLGLKEFGDWLVDRNNPLPDRLIEWAGESLANFGLDREALNARLGQGRVIWLLDGYDEIFDSGISGRVASILGQWFAGERGSKDRLILTSRPHAADREGVMRALGLGEARAPIADLEPGEQRDFLERWFGELYGLGNYKVTGVLDGLWPDIDSYPALQPMRGNPLLLSTIATIYYHGKKLPDRRADLYGKTVDVLLRRRFGDGAEGGSDNLVRRLIQGLAKVARWMMENDQIRDIGEPDFQSQFQAGYYRDREPTQEEELWLKVLGRKLGTHSGLLKLSGDPPRYGFIHLSFQEYLAACAYCEESEPVETLRPYLDQGAWKEVVLLAAGHLFESGPTVHGESLVKKLKSACPEQAGVCGVLVLAARAAAEAPDNALRRELKEALTAQIVIALEKREPSPEADRLSLGLDLGKLGDPRLGMERASRWVKIEPGTFQMGSTGPEIVFEKNACQPVHTVEITREFWLGRYPVTNSEYRIFLEQGGYEIREFWSDAGWEWLNLKGTDFDRWFDGYSKKYGIDKKWKEFFQPETKPKFWNDPRFNGSNQPVVGVNWYEAEAYCSWLSLRLRAEQPELLPKGYEVRLPTEAQWEYAARGKKGRAYPWGEEKPDDQRANFVLHLDHSSPVGTYPLGATLEGVQDLSGNVWEWCLDPWDENAYKKRKAGEKDPVASGDEAFRVVRGGSWINDAGGLAGAFRYRSWAGYRDYDFGFRCCLSRCP